MTDINKENKEKLIETLQNTVDAENMLHLCSSHLASLIKNGRIRSKFNSLSESAEKNKKILMQFLDSLGASSYLPVNKCRFCNLKAESFSLLGALNLGLEILDIEIKLFFSLLKLTDNPADESLFTNILNEKKDTKAFLKNEKNFASEGKRELSLIDSYCIPEIISKLWH